MFTEFIVETGARDEFLEVTTRVQQLVDQWGVKNGICFIFVPHTTAAITINENADPTVKADLLRKLRNLIPWEDDYEHLEGNSAAHLKASLLGSSEQVIIREGNLMLGTWQGIYFAEFDGPRQRKVFVKLIRD